MPTIVADYLRTVLCLATIAAVTAATVLIAIAILKADLAALLLN
jgi:hypothetical protein